MVEGADKVYQMTAGGAVLLNSTSQSALTK
jgi:hypothetical protein